MHRPVCAECRVEMRPSLNGVAYLEKSEDLTGNVVRRALHQGDEWQCPGCMHRIITGWGRKPLADHLDPEFDGMVTAYKVVDSPDGLYVEEDYELRKRTLPYGISQLREMHHAGRKP